MQASNSYDDVNLVVLTAECDALADACGKKLITPAAGSNRIASGQRRTWTMVIIIVH